VSDLSAVAQGLVYRWKVNGPLPITRAVLSWSPGKAVSPGRYWIEFPAERVGNEWVARLPAMLAGMASEAYVNVGDEAGVVVSSTLIVRDGLDPMTTPGPLWAEESLWDLERGAAAWRTPAPWSPKTVFAFAPPAGIRLGPDKGGKEFVLLSNSAILASGRAGKHKGIRLCIDGEGQAGTLKVAFLRDTNSLDEIAHVAEVTYDAGVTTHDIPWSAFRMTSKIASPVSLPAPFDAIQFSGARADEKRVTIQTVTLIP
jgi:hypothetical protein